MDPISAVAAISSFVSVAGALQKLLKKLGKYLRTILHAVSEIAALADQVSGFSLQLIVLQETLEGLPESLQQSVSKRNVDQYHLDGAWKLVDSFKELLLALKPLRGSEKANVVQKTYARFKWLQTKTKADLFRASLNTSTCSLNLFVSTVILMGKSYESAEAQRPPERPPERVLGRTAEAPPKGASSRPSDLSSGNQPEPSLSPRREEKWRFQSRLTRLETLKRQVKYEQYKTEVGFDACQQVYEKHAAEAIEIRTMDRSIKATLVMADEAYEFASAMAEEGEMGEMGEMDGEAEEGQMGEMGEMDEEVEEVEMS